MKRIDSLSDLLMEELADLLDAENQLIKALPKMAAASQSPELKGILENYTEVTKEQVDRLQDIFNNMGQDPQGVNCKAVQKFIEASEDIVTTTEKSLSRDAAILSVAQRIEHYEITGYVKTREHAEDLGHKRVVALLDDTLNEERAMNLYLNELAQSMINVQAIVPGQSDDQGFYMPEKFNRDGIKQKPKGMDVSRFISEGNPNTQEDSDKGK